MSVTDDTDTEILDQVFPEPEVEPEPNPDDTPADEPDEKAKFASLQAEIEKLAGKSSGVDELVALGKEFLAKQSAPPTVTEPLPDIEAGKKRLRKWGEDLQRLALGDDPEALGRYMFIAMNEVSDSKVASALAQHGSPMADKAGAMVLRSFLADKKDEAPEGDKVHPLIAKEFVLAPNQRAWLATASDADAKGFLEDRWDAAAGKVLRRSSAKARPRNIGGGGGSAGAGGGGVTSVAGLDARQQHRLEAFAADLWPDPKVRAVKWKEFAESMRAEIGAQ
jgi:hypothetical protein